jgi:hypothetical protein
MLNPSRSDTSELQQSIRHDILVVSECILMMITNSYRTIEIRKAYARRAIHWNRAKLIFIDEAGFDLFKHRGRGRARAGHRATVVAAAPSKGPRLNVIAAISQDGLLLLQCYIGLTDSARYSRFLHDLMAAQTELFRRQDWIIIQDGASIHRSADARSAFNQPGRRHQYEILPPYSPQLNAIEEFWGWLRGRFNGLQVSIPLKNQVTLLTNINQCATILSGNESTLCASFIDHVDQYLERALAGEHFVD